MYLEIPQGSKINIQGLDCHIPPVGYVFNIITKKLEYRGIYSRSINPKEQYWERIQLPVWYKDVMKAWDLYDKKKKEDDEDFFDERLEEFKSQEWDRRLNGFWFMNNGTAVYLTGFYYMLLQWFCIDIGYPKFIIPHLHKLYFLQYCLEDPLCMGMIDVTKRRFLKTFIGGLFILEYVTRTKMVNGALQSKTGNDAKKVFGKAIVYPFRKFPKFFRPEYDMSLGINPKTEMRFQKTNIRGRKAEDSIDKEELGSLIDWGSADPIHYDGQKVHRYFSDEWGKTTEANIFDRHEVVRYCLLDEEGNIIGKCLYSTTVEKLESDKDGVQEAARQLWDASNQNSKEANGMTQSGLYRFFQTSDEGRNFDIYGYPNVGKTIKEILSDRESVKNNIRSLSARMRKEPRTIEEAFMADGDKCIFNIINIRERENKLADNPIHKRNILFFRNPRTEKVEWRDARTSDGDFCWKFTKILKIEDSNKSYTDGGIKIPSNKKRFKMTVDSYSNSQGGKKYGSEASAWVGEIYFDDKGNKKRKAIGHLLGRPNTKDILHQQVLLCAEYHGSYVWYEHTADDYDAYFRNYNRTAYLGRYPLSTIPPEKRATEERHRGFPITPFSLTKQHDTGIYHFQYEIDDIDFEKVLEVGKIFDPYKRTEYDTMVSYLMLLVVMNDDEVVMPPPKDPLIEIFENKNHVATRSGGLPINLESLVNVNF